MVFDRVNERIRQHIITEIGVDIAITSRQRKQVEARTLYYVILCEITPSQSLAKIGKSVGKSHATVIYGIENFKTFCFYNKNLELIKHKIINLYKSGNDYDRIQCIDDEIYRLELMVVELKKQRESVFFNKTLTELDLVV
jgi:hypothetical protein